MQTKIYKQSNIEQVKCISIKTNLDKEKQKQIKPFIYVQKNKNQNH